MGYACPVCGVPQRDGEHLANHVAFTAMLHGDEHEDWLDEHVPDWSGTSPADLAKRVVDYAPEAEYEEVFEDTVHDHTHGGDDLFDEGRGHGPGRVPFDVEAATRRGAGDLDTETQEVFREAQELTRRMHDEEGGERTDEEEGRADEEKVDEEGERMADEEETKGTTEEDAEETDEGE